jgi:hypothetical protein
MGNIGCCLWWLVFGLLAGFVLAWLLGRRRAARPVRAATGAVRGWRRRGNADCRRGSALRAELDRLKAARAHRGGLAQLAAAPRGARPARPAAHHDELDQLHAELLAARAQLAKELSAHSADAQKAGGAGQQCRRRRPSASFPRRAAARTIWRSSRVSGRRSRSCCAATASGPSSSSRQRRRHAFARPAGRRRVRGSRLPTTRTPGRSQAELVRQGPVGGPAPGPGRSGGAAPPLRRAQTKGEADHDDQRRPRGGRRRCLPITRTCAA